MRNSFLKILMFPNTHHVNKKSRVWFRFFTRQFDAFTRIYLPVAISTYVFRRDFRNNRPHHILHLWHRRGKGPRGRLSLLRLVKVTNKSIGRTEIESPSIAHSLAWLMVPGEPTTPYFDRKPPLSLVVVFVVWNTGYVIIHHPFVNVGYQCTTP